MTDIVEQLRLDRWHTSATTAMEAAAEIERLRAALDNVLDITNEEWHVRTDSSRLYEIRSYARAALAHGSRRREGAMLTDAEVAGLRLDDFVKRTKK